MPGPRVQHRFQNKLEEKYCSKCDKWKVLKKYAKCKRTWDGLQSRCKKCKNIVAEKCRRKLGIKPQRTEHRFQGDLEEKHCLRCDDWKKLKEFRKHKTTWDGLQSWCKVCESNAREKRRRELGIEKRLLAEHRFQGALEEKHCLSCGQWKVLKHFFKHKRASDGLQSWCKVCTNIAYKKRVSTELGRERSRAQVRKAAMKRRANGKQNVYRRKRLRADPAYAILCRLRCRVWHALKRQGATKSIGTITLLGCTPVFFRSYIEKQFVDGMTWDNRGKWHIDHRVPCTAFNMLNPLQQRYCFWYKNHQPMFANDNLSKSNMYKQEDKELLIKAWIFENVFKRLI